MIYLKSFNGKPELLHTIINKKLVNEWTYIVAIGHGGGGAYEEFCAKIKGNEISDVSGVYSLYYNPDEWEFVIDHSNSENVYSEIEANDLMIIEELNAEIWENYVYWDDDNGVYTIHDKYVIQINVDGFFTSPNWDSTLIELMSRNYWGLSLTF